MRPLQLPTQIMLQLMIGTTTHNLERISPKLGELLPVVGMAASAGVLKLMGYMVAYMENWMECTGATVVEKESLQPVIRILAQ